MTREKHWGQGIHPATQWSQPQTTVPRSPGPVGGGGGHVTLYIPHRSVGGTVGALTVNPLHGAPCSTLRFPHFDINSAGFTGAMLNVNTPSAPCSTCCPPPPTKCSQKVTKLSMYYYVHTVIHMRDTMIRVHQYSYYHVPLCLSNAVHAIKE